MVLFAIYNYKRYKTVLRLSVHFLKYIRANKFAETSAVCSQQSTYLIPPCTCLISRRSVGTRIRSNRKHRTRTSDARRKSHPKSPIDQRIDRRLKFSHRSDLRERATEKRAATASEKVRLCVYIKPPHRAEFH